MNREWLLILIRELRGCRLSITIHDSRITNLLRFVPHHLRVVLQTVAEVRGVAGKFRGHLPGRQRTGRGSCPLFFAARAGLDEVASEIGVSRSSASVVCAGM